MKGILNWNCNVNGILIVLKTISFLFLESVVESYHLERLRQQELRLKIILRWARVGQFATDLYFSSVLVSLVGFKM